MANLLAKFTPKTGFEHRLYTSDNGTDRALLEIDVTPEAGYSIGLRFEENRLVSYDGISYLHGDAIDLIETAGFDVPKRFKN